MMKTHFKIYLLLFLIFALSISVESYSQNRNRNNFYSKEKKISQRNVREIYSVRINQNNLSRGIFNKIVKAFNNGNISNLSKYIKHQTYLSLSNEIEGYYSENQVFYVLKNFIKRNKITTFKLNSIVTNVENPFATGKYFQRKEGKIKSMRFYISLKRINNKWNILQITFN